MSHQHTRLLGCLPEGIAKNDPVLRLLLGAIVVEHPQLTSTSRLLHEGHDEVIILPLLELEVSEGAVIVLDARLHADRLELDQGLALIARHLDYRGVLGLALDVDATAHPLGWLRLLGLLLRRYDLADDTGRLVDRLLRHSVRGSDRHGRGVATRPQKEGDRRDERQAHQNNTSTHRVPLSAIEPVSQASMYIISLFIIFTPYLPILEY